VAAATAMTARGHENFVAIIIQVADANTSALVTKQYTSVAAHLDNYALGGHHCSRQNNGLKPFTRLRF
jgi:hypothetical protein